MTTLSDLLQQLDEAWRRLGMPVDQVLAPGLTEDEILAALAPITNHPSREVIDWFSWHNGKLDLSTPFMAHPIAFDLLSLSEAIDHSGKLGTLASEVASSAAETEPADYFWRPGWLAIAGNWARSTLTIDIATDPDTCAVWHVDWSDAEFGNPIAASLAEIIEFCLTALASDLYQWSDAEPRGWIYDYLTLPLEWRQSRIT